MKRVDSCTAISLTMTTSRRCARTVSEALVWYHFIPLRSTKGESWYRIFNLSGAETTVQEYDVLVDRMRRPDECLDTALRDLNVLRKSSIHRYQAAPTSIRGVLEEAYRGALAYWYFRQNLLSAAECELKRALQAVHQTLRSDQFLLTYSLKNIQLITNRARIARRQGKWARMSRHLNICDRMLVDRAPLFCHENSAIYLTDICSFYQAIQSADMLDAEALKILSTPDSLAKGFRHTINSIWSSFQIANEY